MSGKIILTILGKGWQFPGIGPLPPFWSLMVSLGTFKVPVGVSFCWCVTVSVYWSSRSSGSLLVCHLGPIWFWYVVSLGYVTPLCFFLSLLKFFLFYFTILCWFCHTLTWIRHRCTWVPNPEPPFHLPPHIISLGHPSAPVPSILYQYLFFFVVRLLKVYYLSYCQIQYF